MSDEARQAWEKVKGDEPEFDRLDADFRNKLIGTASVIKQGGTSSGIAGLEEFEAEVAKATEAERTKAPSPLTGAPTLREGAAPAATPSKGSAKKGAKKASKTKQTPEEYEQQALKSAVAAGGRVEASGPHSPGKGTAARPLAAEAPGNAPSPEEVKGAEKQAQKQVKTLAKANKSSKSAKKASKKK